MQELARGWYLRNVASFKCIVQAKSSNVRMGTHTLYSCQVLTLCHFQFRHLCNGKKVGLSTSNPRVPKTERCEIDNHHLQNNTPKLEEEEVVVVQENHDRKRRFEEEFREFTKLKEK